MSFNFIKNISLYSLISGLISIAPLYASLGNSASEKGEVSTREFQVTYMEKNLQKVFSFSSHNDATVLDMRKALADKLHIPLDEIHIIMFGKHMPDIILLSSFDAEGTPAAVRRKIS